MNPKKETIEDLLREAGNKPDEILQIDFGKKIGKRIAYIFTSPFPKKHNRLGGNKKKKKEKPDDGKV